MNFPTPMPSEPDRAMLGRSHQRYAPKVAKGAIVLADANAARSTAMDEVTERMTPQPSVRDVMLAAIPNLRAFAMSLSGNADRADDLVQETVMRAMALAVCAVVAALGLTSCSSSTSPTAAIDRYLTSNYRWRTSSRCDSALFDGMKATGLHRDKGIS